MKQVQQNIISGGSDAGSAPRNPPPRPPPPSVPGVAGAKPEGDTPVPPPRNQSTAPYQGSDKRLPRAPRRMFSCSGCTSTVHAVQCSATTSIPADATTLRTAESLRSIWWVWLRFSRTTYATSLAQPNPYGYGLPPQQQQPYQPQFPQNYATPYPVQYPGTYPGAYPQQQFGAYPPHPHFPQPPQPPQPQNQPPTNPFQ